METRASLPPELHGGWLAFRSTFERAVVAPIPALWWEQDTAGLLQMLSEARAQGKVTPLTGAGQLSSSKG
jgi:hypothetical protein